jgi:alpha-mannosidase
MRHIFHLIANAHLDPVWLWGWREGLNEGIITCRTILDLMDEFPELTFVRGEAAIYRHIEENDPDTFRRIVRQVEAGRWDIVGGTEIQPDTNLASTEVLARQFASGQSYFLSRFGRAARVAWAADSFGHSAGLPEIMAAAGMTGFAFTRPFPDILPLSRPAFWWEAPSAARVLAYRPPVGWYGTGRDETPRRLDQLLEAAGRDGLVNVGVFYGLGDHGGGPTRRHLREIRQWSDAHPEVTVLHSGLHRFFDALRAELGEAGAPALEVVRGELNFTLRGCYASVAKLKFAFRQTESAVSCSERTDAVVRSALHQTPSDMRETWRTVLFNSFHDILPGSSIETAMEEQMASLGGALHEARRAELAALNALAHRVDTTVIGAGPATAGPRTPPDMPVSMPVLVWNPHPWRFRGHVEWEANMDYRPIDAYKGRPEKLPLQVLDPAGKPVPHQSVATDNALAWDVPWRKRVVVPVDLPPLGWSVYQYGWMEGAVAPESPGQTCSASTGEITNAIYGVSARPGAQGVRILHRDRELFEGGALTAIVVEDPWGSWGGPDHGEPTNLSVERELWRVTAVDVLEHGPECSRLWVRYVGRSSHLELTFSLYRGREAVDVAARLLWNERQARLKLVLPIGMEEAEFEVPGGRVRRAGFGEVPAGSWVRAIHGHGELGFASDSLSCFDSSRGALRVTVARASGYAMDGTTAMPAWRTAVDRGELKFRFLLNPGGEELPFLAQALEQPPMCTRVAAKAGDLPRTGSLAELSPSSLRLQALKRAEDGKGLVLRVQEMSGRGVEATLRWLGDTIPLGHVEANSIVTWRLAAAVHGGKAQRCSILET